MTYWHMQMHPNDKWTEEEYLLLKKNIIGIGDWEEQRSQIEKFKNEMRIGDIVLIKRGAKPLALVEVISEYREVKKGEVNDWIKYVRDVRVLDKDTSNMSSFPQPRGTLQKSINKYTTTYKYIDNWFKKYKNPNIKEHGLKIEKVAIKNYKMFKDFEIDFLDNKNNIMPLIVIAGINGTGKTTILESLINRNNALIDFKLDGKEVKAYKKEKGSYEEELQEHIIYLSALTNIDDKVENVIREYIDYIIYEKSGNAAIGTENLQKDMDEIFDGFDIAFYFKKIDYKTKKTLFSKENDDRDDVEFGLKDLSTGERTLLSKMFYLHLKDPKGKVILIDEPETSLHPSWQNKILKFYEEFSKLNNCQIIIATHSPQIIASAKNEYIRVLRKNSNGNIEAVKVNNAEGRDINSILFDVMGEVEYRPKEFVDKIDRLFMEIDNKNLDKAKKLLNDLKKSYGEKDATVIEAQMLIDMYENE